LAFSLVKNQCRFFCSAELYDGAATAREERLVTRTISAGVRQIAQVLPEQRYKDMLQDGMQLGAVHEKWMKCLKPFVKWNSANVKYLRPSIESLRPSPLDLPIQDVRALYGLPDGGIFDRLREADLNFVYETTPFAHSVDYLRERAHRSIAVRVPTADGEMRLIAWNIVHMDGSLGLMHILPEHRGRTLATGVSLALIESVAEARRWDGTQGWSWLEVEEDNMASRKSLRHPWREAWKCYWMAVDVARIVPEDAQFTMSKL
jgi:hypothetical protein